MIRALVLCSLLAAASARAVIVSGGDGSGNLTGTGAGNGWNYVGTVNGASGVYLGDYGGSYWVITAAHVGSGNFTLNSVTYEAVGGTAVSLTSSEGIAVDLTIFRIAADPGLTTLSLSASTPANGTSVTMIGYGVNRGSSLTRWDLNWNETTNPVLGIYSGYKWTGTAAKRWGTNTITGTGTVGVTQYVTTNFLQASGSAQATVGDSGGGVFATIGGVTQLVGIMGLVSSFTNQPGSTSVYGNQTYSADISVYRSQILSIVTPIPEPTVLMLGGLAGLVFLIRGIRTRRAALR